jgi:hypothetical protein
VDRGIFYALYSTETFEQCTTSKKEVAGVQIFIVSITKMVNHPGGGRSENKFS